MTEPPLVHLEGVSIGFDGHPVLRDLSLSVHRGQTLAIIGESGCGKTVILKLIVGLLRPERGRVLIEGRDLRGFSPAELVQLRKRFGFLFQGGALFDSLSAGENVAYPLRALHGLGESEIQDRVRERLREVGLADAVAGRMPAELSGGMRKRVGLARALALDPEIMLYDEPTTGLDPITTDAINELIVQTRQRRPITSLVVTHEMRTVRRVADRVVMLYPLSRLNVVDSQILQDGPMSVLDASTDERVRRFIGPIN